MNGVQPLTRKEVLTIAADFTREQKELFCCYYVMLGDLNEAAIKAGIPRDSALSDGLELLRSSFCRRKIAELRSLTDTASVIAGLRRLAFGSCADGIMLAFMDEAPSPDTLRSLDLFCVSEFKHGKNGSEVRFFDRQRAVEKLYELETAFSDRDKSAALIEALSASAGEELP